MSYFMARAPHYHHWPLNLKRWIRDFGPTIFELLVCSATTLIMDTFLHSVAGHRRYFYLDPNFLRGERPAGGSVQHLSGLSHPSLNGNYLSSIACAMIALWTPIILFVILNLRIRSIWDFSAATIGVIKCLTLGTLCLVLMKKFIGGFRPYFLEHCTIDMDVINSIPADDKWSKAGFFNSSVCKSAEFRGDGTLLPPWKKKDPALESFPSGHTLAMFATMVFLSLYLNAKLKTFSDAPAAFWKLAILFIPLVSACLLAGTLTADFHHHSYDIIAGGIFGTLIGIAVYRQTYCSIFNPNINHIPLIIHNENTSPASPRLFHEYIDPYNTGLTASSAYIDKYRDVVQNQLRSDADKNKNNYFNDNSSSDSSGSHGEQDANLEEMGLGDANIDVPLDSGSLSDGTISSSRIAPKVPSGLPSTTASLASDQTVLGANCVSRNSSTKSQTSASSSRFDYERNVLRGDEY